MNQVATSQSLEQVSPQRVVGAIITPERIELLKTTICKDATDDELALFIQVCNRLQLDPFARQIYAVKRRNSRTGRDEMTIQTGIDGFRLTAARTGEHAGTDDAEYDNEDDFRPRWARVTVYRFVKGQRVSFTAKARWEEYVQKKDNNPVKQWKQMPYLMLAKCAEALALRKAFPAELSGIYTEDEMGQAANDDVPTNQSKQPQPQPQDKQEPVRLSPTKSSRPLEDFLRMIASAKTDGELALVAAEMKGNISKEDHSRAVDEYKARAKVIAERHEINKGWAHAEQQASADYEAG